MKRLAATPPFRRCPGFAWILVVTAVLTAACGCVQRRMTIRSEPPGALVYVDNVEIGTTPVSTHFLYYGARQIRLVKDGYETLTVLQPVRAPWYQIPPLDFFSENLVPGEIRDQQAFTYRLVPQLVVPSDQLLGRAQELRGRATASGSTLTMPSGTAPPYVAPPAGPPPERLPPPAPILPTTPPAAPGQTAAPLQNEPGGTIPYSLPPARPGY